MTAAVSVVLSWPALIPTVALAVFVCMQLVRTGFEERLLTRAFPTEYPPYRTRTARLLPGIV
jgi:protein-S-isoprenylcysteine O-methyltransferase Ste14